MSHLYTGRIDPGDNLISASDVTWEVTQNLPFLGVPLTPVQLEQLRSNMCMYACCILRESTHII